MQAPEPYLIWKEAEGQPAAGSAQAISRSTVQKWIRNAALLTLLLIALPPIPFRTSVLWLLAMATGYAATVLIAIVMILPLRRLVSWPEGRISVPQHQQLGEWALWMSLLHTALFLVSDGVSLEYLLPSQPRFMIAGNVGLLLLLLLVVTSYERVRVALFGQLFRFRTVHVAGSIVLVLVTVAHMIGSSAYVSHAWKSGFLAAAAAVIVAMCFKRPKDPKAPKPAEATPGETGS